MLSLNHERWFPLRRPGKGKSLRLFVFPYAGGSAAIFRSWLNVFPESVEVLPVQLPGRSARLHEPAFTQIPAQVNAIYEVVRCYIDCQFAFFGHSMGALIAFELARRLKRDLALGPVALFVSGSHPPHLPPSDPPIYHLPRAEFIQKLKELNGTPKQILQNAEMMELFLPTLRSDFEACDTYVFAPGQVLDCPIVVFGGRDDASVGPEILPEWRIHTRGTCAVHLLPGDHFFVHNTESLLFQRLLQELVSYGGKPAVR